MEGWAGRLTAAQLHRLWQLLLKGFEEVRLAPDPLVAAEMALLRVMHAADLPDPGSLVKRLEELAANPPAPGSLAPASAAAGSQAKAVPAPSAGWPQLVQQVEASGQLRIAQIMQDWVRVVAIGAAELTYAVAPGYPGDPSAELREALQRATGERWQVDRVEDGGAPTLREVEAARKAAEAEALARHPLVEATMIAFPGAQIIDDNEPGPRQGDRNWSRRA